MSKTQSRKAGGYPSPKISPQLSGDFIEYWKMIATNTDRYFYNAAGKIIISIAREFDLLKLVVYAFGVCA